MPASKGYWIVHIDVTDADAYKAYVAANGEALAKYGGRFLTRGGAYEGMEGPARSRHVVLEFPSYQSAIDCYRSPEYAKACKLRAAASKGELVIVEGYKGPQPGDS